MAKHFKVRIKPHGRPNISPSVVTIHLFPNPQVVDLMMRRRAQTPGGRLKNVVIVGLAGAGKSSLINLLCPDANARVSNDAEHCTTVEARYSCSELQCIIHDTIGLPEGGSWLSRIPILKQFSKTERDTERLKRYIRGLVEKKELDLLIYCMSGRQRNKIESQKNSYQTFKSIAGGAPVVVVVTGLDDLTPGGRRGWWERNGGERLGMNNAPGYHACIIALPKERVYEEDKEFYNQSCQEVKTIITERLKYK